MIMDPEYKSCWMEKSEDESDTMCFRSRIGVDKTLDTINNKISRKSALQNKDNVPYF